MSRQHGEIRPDLLEVLGDIVGCLGRGVWRKRYLIEAIGDPDLRRADRALMRERLATGARLLAILESWFARERGNPSW